MTSHNSAHLLVFLLVYAELAYSGVHYITPSPKVSCPQEHPCITLSQFAANSNYIVNETNVYLLFLLGNHSLDRELSLTSIHNFSMTKNVQDNEIVIVECTSPSGSFVINETIFASIKGLHFIGCGGNTVTWVDQFVLEDTIFQGVEGIGTALELNLVSDASIVRSSFLSNTNGSKYEQQTLDSTALLQDEFTGFGTYLMLDTTFVSTIKYAGANLTYGGALYIANSSVMIDDTKFDSNRAQLGAAIAVIDGKISIRNSQFVNNNAMSDISKDISFGVILLFESETNIDNSTFIHNKGGVLAAKSSRLHVARSTYSHNIAHCGGVIFTSGSSFKITNSTLTNNSAYAGGVLASSESSFRITSSNFTHNSACVHDGGVMFILFSEFSLYTTTFTNNSAVEGGGVLSTEESSFNVTNSNFNNNSGTSQYGLVIWAHKSSFNIANCNFANNTAATDAVEVLYFAFRKSSSNITSSTFTNNSGGVMTMSHLSLNIINCTFTKNSALIGAGVMSVLYESSINIMNSMFHNNNVAIGGGGVMDIMDKSSLNVTNSTFTNSAADFGGVINTAESSLLIANSLFSNNRARRHGGVMFTVGSLVYIANSTFDNSLGSLYTFSSNVTFSGYTRFENCIEPPAMTGENVIASQEGGAITSYQSSVLFIGVISLLNNQARNGGAILATESTISIYGETIIAYNTATNGNGGGIYLHQSDLVIKGNSTFSHNRAVRGGGVHASGSSISVYQHGTLQIINNRAEEDGGGIYLEINPRVYLLKHEVYTSSFKCTKEDEFLIFTGNHAKCGGAMYVADDTNSAACSSTVECFIQTLALYTLEYAACPVNVIFSGNTATKYGYNLFGGLLDRCIPSPFAEVYQKHILQYNGVTYLESISDIRLDTVASLPVRICFCNSEGLPDCSFGPPIIKVKKGETFTVSLVAVDQVNHPVAANINSSLASPDGGLDEGQQTQRVTENCTVLTFNVFSTADSETMKLFADGPCGSATSSTQHMNIQFLSCTCPVGFEPSKSNSKSTTCECKCHSALSPYITNCNPISSSLTRVNTNSWIIYINDTDSPGYVIHPNCPFDYCYPQTVNISMNFNLPNGEDAQCAYNRKGVLCGACRENLSLSLGSSHCLSCGRHWPAVFVTVLLVAIIAGVLLVTALLFLNMTVAVGLINSFIFYANIVSANSSVFFSSSDPSFPTVFVAWLNLDIGIDVCFFNGFDTYTKIWLQLTFPLYIVSLVALVIIVSEYYPKFAGLVGKKDPVATLATLILLSYSKLLSVTIAALSFTVLHYPDGSREIVWLPDANVKYFHGKHIVLIIVAVLIILVGIPYTILLFFWQWLVQTPRWKVFTWTRNTKLIAFIAAYHAPYRSMYRYWTGLLLIVRVVLYITAALTLSDNPQTSLLTTTILVGGICLLKGIIGVRVYKKSYVDVVDMVMYFNILALALFSFYDFKTDITKQTAIAYTSTLMTFILLVGVVVSHVTLLFKEKKVSTEVNEYPLAPVQPSSSVTFSDIEISEHHCPLAEFPSDDTVHDITDHQTLM